MDAATDLTGDGSVFGDDATGFCGETVSVVSKVFFVLTGDDGNDGAYGIA